MISLDLMKSSEIRIAGDQPDELINLNFSGLLERRSNLSKSEFIPSNVSSIDYNRSGTNSDPFDFECKDYNCHLGNSRKFHI